MEQDLYNLRRASRQDPAVALRDVEAAGENRLDAHAPLLTKRRAMEMKKYRGRERPTAQEQAPRTLKARSLRSER